MSLPGGTAPFVNCASRSSTFAGLDASNLSFTERSSSTAAGARPSAASFNKWSAQCGGNRGVPEQRREREESFLGIQGDERLRNGAGGRRLRGRIDQNGREWLLHFHERERAGKLGRSLLSLADQVRSRPRHGAGGRRRHCENA